MAETCCVGLAGLCLIFPLAHHLSLFPPFLLIGANLRKPPTYVDNFDCADVKPLQQQICLRAQFFSCKKLICKLRENNIS
jgi:hypothetical protein